jgi:4-hydroxy-tetrahydrodipicolinate synthase
MSGRLPSVVAPIPTPLSVADRIDDGALRDHLEWLAREGLDGVLILGTNGEFPSFTFAERRRLAEVAARAAGPLQLLLGVGSSAIGEVCELLDVAASNGYSAVLCPPPFYFRSAPLIGLVRFFRTVLERSQLPVLLYHIPQVTGLPISDELLDAIGEDPHLAGVKDSSGSGAELERLLVRFRKRIYYVGSDRLVGLCMRSGGHGSISAVASVVPSLVAAVQADPSRQPDLNEVRSLLEEYGLGPAVKAILRWRGLGAYTTRPPLEGLDRERERALLQRFRGLTR